MDKGERHLATEPKEIDPQAFTRRVVLLTVVFAALLALSFLGNMNAIRDLMRTQIHYFDQHSLYQSLTMRELMYKTNSLRMEADLLDRGPAMKQTTRMLYKSILSDMKADENRFREDKKKVEEKSKAFAARRDKNLSRAASFDVSGFFLLIAIILAAISSLTASQRLIKFALGSAALGVIFLLNGYVLVFRIPFIQ
jgi:hypothetical protein